MTLRPTLLVLALVVLPVKALPADAPAPGPVATQAASPADAILGRWKAPEGGVVVAISRDAGALGGVVVESPEKATLVGKPMFRGLTYDAARAEWSGEVFAVKKGEFVPAVIRLTKSGFELTAGKGFLSRKLAWTRA